MKWSKVALRCVVPLTVSTALIGAAGTSSAASTQPDATALSVSDTAGQVHTTTDRLARELASELGSAEGLMRDTFVQKDSVDLLHMADQIGASASFESRASRGNAAILRAKGLSQDVGSLLEIRLGDGSMRDGLRRGQSLLIAGESDDEARTLRAYDSAGRVHKLDARRTPDRPVLVVGVNGDRALKAGLAKMRSVLAQNHVGANLPEDIVKDSSATLSGGYRATVTDRVYLRDDHEPWHKGGAEIYTLVAGVNPDGQPQVDTVQMPYADHDGKNYHLNPPQILVNWSHFKFNAVDLVMMEEDSGTNYQELAQAVAKGLLTTINATQYVPLVEAVIKAIPQGWFQDDHDYVDSWYTIQQGTWDPYFGASDNAELSFGPWWVDEL
jgi:hypothetical protein